VSLGSWLTFGEAVDQDATTAVVRRAFELGVNLFDTANVYARGGAEEVLGRAIADLPRDDIVVATKVFGEMGQGPLDRGLSAAAIVYQCEQSLRRLGVVTIDLYQCHRYDPEVPLEETCGAMDGLVRAGQIRHWGVSEWTAAQIQESLELCEREGLTPPVSDQSRYSMLQREPEEEVLPACGRLGLGVLAFSPLAQGMLTGKYRRGRTAGRIASLGRAGAPAPRALLHARALRARRAAAEGRRGPGRPARSRRDRLDAPASGGHERHRRRHADRAAGGERRRGGARADGRGPGADRGGPALNRA